MDAFKQAHADDAKPLKLESGSVDMSIACIVSKKAVHKSAVIRKTILRRLKSAITLIVARGAHAHELEGAVGVGPHRSKFVLGVGKSEKANNWILPGMSFVQSFSDSLGTILKTACW